MSLIRWEPISELEPLRRQMDRMLASFVGRGMPGPALETPLGFSPYVEIYETDKEVVVNAELPGVDPKAVAVETTDDAIILSGETRKHDEIKDDNYYRSERQFGSFRRVIASPSLIKSREAKATFKDGLLTVRVPFADEAAKASPHKVNVEPK